MLAGIEGVYHRLALYDCKLLLRCGEELLYHCLVCLRCVLPEPLLCSPLHVPVEVLIAH